MPKTEPRRARRYTKENKNYINIGDVHEILTFGLQETKARKKMPKVKRS